MADVKYTAEVIADIDSLRKTIAAGLSNVQFSVSKQSITDATSRISTSVVPKIEFRANKLATLRKEIQEGLGAVPISFRVDDKTINIFKELTTNKSVVVEIEVKDSKNQFQALGKIQKDVALGFEAMSAAKDAFALNVEQKFPKIISHVAALNTQLAQSKLLMAELGAAIAASPQLNVLVKTPLKKVAGAPQTGSQTTTPQDEYRVLKGELNSYKNTVVDLKKEIRGLSSELSTVTSKHKTLTEKTKEAAGATKDFAEKTGITASRLLSYLLPAAAIFQLTRGIGFAKEEIFKLDQSLTKLKQTLSDKQGFDIGALLSGGKESALRYGTDPNEIIDVQTQLVKNRKKFSNAGQVNKVTDLLSKTRLSPEFGNPNETFEGVNNIIDQFELSTSKYEEVLDVVAKLSKNFNIKPANLFAGVKSGGGSFSKLGGGYKDYLAILTGLKQSSGSDETTIGSGVSTILPRILSTENRGFIEKQFGVSVVNPATGQLKSLLTILREIGKEYRKLGTDQQAVVLQKLAGTTHTKIGAEFFADISGPNSNVLDALDKANNAVGELNKNAVLAAKSLQNPLDKIATLFKTTFDQISEDKKFQDFLHEVNDLLKLTARLLGDITPLVGPALTLGLAAGAGLIYKKSGGFIQGLLNKKKVGAAGFAGAEIPPTGGFGAILPIDASGPITPAGKRFSYDPFTGRPSVFQTPATVAAAAVAKTQNNTLFTGGSSVGPNNIIAGGGNIRSTGGIYGSSPFGSRGVAATYLASQSPSTLQMIQENSYSNIKARYGLGEMQSDVQNANSAIDPSQTISGFKTSLGSTYTYNPATGTTQRTKSLHPGHDPNDVGIKAISGKTVFVHPDMAREIGMFQGLSSSGKRIAIENGKVVLLSNNPVTGQLGKENIISDPTVHLSPKIGLSPLELSHIDEMGFYKGNHPGNPITSLFTSQVSIFGPNAKSRRSKTTPEVVPNLTSHLVPPTLSTGIFADIENQLRNGGTIDEIQNALRSELPNSSRDQRRQMVKDVRARLDAGSRGVPGLNQSNFSFPASGGEFAGTSTTTQRWRGVPTPRNDNGNPFAINTPRTPKYYIEDAISNDLFNEVPLQSRSRLQRGKVEEAINRRRNARGLRTAIDQYGPALYGNGLIGPVEKKYTEAFNRNTSQRSDESDLLGVFGEREAIKKQSATIKRNYDAEIKKGLTSEETVKLTTQYNTLIGKNQSRMKELNEAQGILVTSLKDSTAANAKAAVAAGEEAAARRKAARSSTIKTLTGPGAALVAGLALEGLAGALENQGDVAIGGEHQFRRNRENAGLTGGLSGAGSGAVFGSLIAPGIGTLIGGVAGGLYGSFKGESDQKTRDINRYLEAAGEGKDPRKIVRNIQRASDAGDLSFYGYLNDKGAGASGARQALNAPIAKEIYNLIHSGGTVDQAGELVSKRAAQNTDNAEQANALRAQYADLIPEISEQAALERKRNIEISAMNRALIDSSKALRDFSDSLTYKKEDLAVQLGVSQYRNEATRGSLQFLSNGGTAYNPINAGFIGTTVDRFNQYAGRGALDKTNISDLSLGQLSPKEQQAAIAGGNIKYRIEKLTERFGGLVSDAGPNIEAKKGGLTSQFHNELGSTISSLLQDAKGDPELTGLIQKLQTSFNKKIDTNLEEFANNGGKAVADQLIGQFDPVKKTSEILASKLAILAANVENATIAFETQRDVVSRISDALGKGLGSRLEVIDRKRTLGGGYDSTISSLNTELGNVGNTDPQKAINKLARVQYIYGGASQKLQSLQGGSLFSGNDLGPATEAYKTAQLEVNKAQLEYVQVLKNADNALSILNKKFGELANHLNETIQTNRGLGQASFTDIIGARLGQSQFEGFGLGSDLKNAGLNRIGDIAGADPQKLEGISNKLQYLSDVTFQQITQGLSLQGNRKLYPGGPTGIEGADLLTQIRGLGRLGNTGENIANLQGEQKGAAETSEQIAKLQALQVDAAIQTARNTALIAERMLGLQPGTLLNQSSTALGNFAPLTGRSTPNVANNPAAASAAHATNVLSGITDLVSGLNKANDTNQQGASALAAALTKFQTGVIVNGGDTSKTQIDANINITGFENTGRDVATYVIIKGVIENLMGQLDQSVASEAELWKDLNTVLGQLDSGYNSRKP